jgi:type II secretory pathway component GspD/PulD (secretin)
VLDMTGGSEQQQQQQGQASEGQGEGGAESSAADGDWGALVPYTPQEQLAILQVRPGADQPCTSV